MVSAQIYAIIGRVSRCEIRCTSCLCFNRLTSKVDINLLTTDVSLVFLDSVCARSPQAKKVVSDDDAKKALSASYDRFKGEEMDLGPAISKVDKTLSCIDVR